MADEELSLTRFAEEEPEIKAKGLYFGFAKRFGVLVKNLGKENVEIVHTENVSLATLHELRRYFQLPLKLEQVSEQKFEELIISTYERDSSQAMQMMGELGEELDLNQLAQELPKSEDLLEREDEAPIIRLINATLSQAIKQGASDIHIETFESRVIIRFRIDGVLQIVLEPPRLLAPLIISRIKVMAKLDIAEKRIPQDGRIALKIGGRAVDVRVSTMPTAHGERIVMRLLDKQAGRLDLSHLGMASETLGRMHKIIFKPHGIILVTGPTGSGKTTTLYAGLTVLNKATRNILTVEDPVEYYIAGIGQTQVNPKVGMTFAKGLRAILRQDPDVVMVGEIRDQETADISIQASLTGHLVLSTVHTNTAIGAVTRLRDMGVEPFLLSSSLLGLLAQRLVRKLCPECKRAKTASEQECKLLERSPADPPTIYEEVGCDKCNNMGYWGRTGIYELVVIDEHLRRMIHQGAGELEMEEYFRPFTPSIIQDGIRRILNGETTIEEVMRVTSAEV